MSKPFKIATLAIALFGFARPKPLEWVIGSFIPKGYVTILAANGGTGKSYLSLYAALCVALGLRFYGQPVSSCPVLVVDYELDEEEQKRRLWRVAEGMGVSVHDPRLEGRLYYFRPSRPLSDPRTHDEVLSIVREHGIGLVVLDSLTIGSGVDTTASDDTIETMMRLKDWGTVLAIDHLSKAASRENQSGATPFGSVFKRNVARSTATLSRVGGGGLVLGFDKSNFGPKRPILGYKMEFSEDDEAVWFTQVELSDAAMVGAERHLDTYDITLLAIEAIYAKTGEAVSMEEVSRWRAENDDVSGVKATTLANHMTVLDQRGAIVRVGDGTVVPASALSDDDPDSEEE